MKAKSKAKAKTRSRSKTRAKPKKSRTTRTTATPRPASITTPPLSPDFKTCEEVEVGDIGGFGITTDETMEEALPRARHATPLSASRLMGEYGIHYHHLLTDHDNPRNRTFDAIPAV